MKIQNWARTFACQPARIYHPASPAEVQEAVLASRQIRVLGSGHSPSDIAMSDQALLQLDRMASVLQVDVPARRVRVQGGCQLKHLAAALDRYGLAIPNLGSIAEQTVAGALATATHGTGLRHGVLSTLVRSLQIVTGDGQLRTVAPDRCPDLWQAVRCSLGCLGVVTEVELEVSEAFDLEVEENESSLDDLLRDLPRRLLTDHYRFWILPDVDRVWEWRARRVPPRGEPTRKSHWFRDQIIGYRVFEALLYLTTLIPALLPSVNRWYANWMFRGSRQSRGPSLHQFTFDCLFRQYVNEWCLPIERTEEAVRRLRELILKHKFRAHLPIEVRFSAADDVWMSPAYGRDSCWIGVILYRPYGVVVETEPYFGCFEQLMQELGGRPHWAKRFGPEADELALMIPHYQEFLQLMDRYDPGRRFSNAFTRRVFQSRTSTVPRGTPSCSS